MSMSAILTGIGVYFATGIVALGLLDLLTRRIRTRLSSATMGAKDKLAISGSFVGNKEATILTIGALWLLWPVAIFSAVKGDKNGKSQ